MVCPSLDQEQGEYQLFIQRNSVVLLSAVLIAARLVIAAPVAKAVAMDGVLKSIPDGSAKIFRSKNYIWAEYCKDNTCDVIRSKSKIPTKMFGDLASAYYYYFSRYEYLEEWQKVPAVAKSIDENLRSTGNGVCHTLAGKELARCRLEQSGHQFGLRIFFIRFDEAVSARVEIPMEEALR